MYLIYDAATGVPSSATETEPTSGTWTIVPQSAIEEHPLSFWNPTDKLWGDEDFGYRYIGVDPGFATTGAHKEIFIEQTQQYLLSQAVSQLFGETSTLHWKLYLILETLAYQGATSPVATDYPIMNAYATWQGVTLADAFTWAKEQIFTGYSIAANGVGAAMKILDDIYVAANPTETEAAFFDVNDWETQVVDPIGGLPPSPTQWPAAFLPSVGGDADPWTWLKLASNSTVNTTAFADVAGMSFTADPNTMYRVELMGAYQTAATTTGIALALDVPAGATIIGQNIASINATGLGGTEQIADATSTGKTTGVRAANTNTLIQFVAHVIIGATGGTVQLKQASEVANSNTVLQANLTAMGFRKI